MNAPILIKLYFFYFLTLFNFVAFAQQSLGYQKRPEGVSIGEVGKSTASQIIISDVPIYQWYRGCGPTALGMVVGYYDAHGYPDLVMGDAQTQTSQVNDMMASEEHYNDYSLPKDYYPNLVQDNSELGGTHTSNSIADYMYTSWSSRNNYWGWSWSSDVGNAFKQFALQQNDNYIITTTRISYNSDTWNYLKDEIDHNRPVVLLVDSSGNGSTDHFVTGIGYDEVSHQYAIYNTWDNVIHWHEFRVLSSSYSWGVYDLTKFVVENNLSTDKIENKVSIYPNPTKGVFHVELTDFSNNFYIEVYESSGRIIKKSTKSTIDISDCKAGIYFIRIRDKGQINTVKLLKK